MRSKRLVLGITLLAGIIAGIIVGKYYEWLNIQAESATEKKQEQLRQELADLKDPFGVFVKIAELANPSVVNISTLKNVTLYYEDDFFPFVNRAIPRKEQQIGSGVIVDKEGYLLTNYHVVVGADEIKVTLADKREFRGKVIGRDELTDLAVVKINATGLIPAVLGDSDRIRVGEWVVAVGNPFGLGHTVTSGIISARRETADGSGYDFVQTDAAINPGNSGGPLVNLRGEVIGINSSIISQSGGNQGIGFAIPSNRAKTIMHKLIESGKIARPYLGVELSDINDSLAGHYGLANLADLLRDLKMKEPRGAFVLSTMEDSSAQKGGLAEGDVVIGFNGQNITNPSDLTKAISNSKIGEEVQLKIIRNGKELTLKVRIGERS